MKKTGFSLLFLLFITFTSFAQTNTGIGTHTPDPSAKLDVVATNKGILIPRVALVNTNNSMPINANPALLPNSLTVYNTTTSVIDNLEPGYYFWLENQWNKLITNLDIVPAPVQTASNGLTLTNDDIKLGGTLTENTIINTNSNTLSVRGNTPNLFNVSNADATATILSVDGANRRVGIGMSAPTANLHVNGTVRLDNLAVKNTFETTDINVILDKDNLVTKYNRNLTQNVGGVSPTPATNIIKTVEVTSSVTRVNFIFHVDGSDPANNGDLNSYVYGNFTIIGRQGSPCKIVDVSLKGHDGTIFVPHGGAGQLTVTSTEISWKANQTDAARNTITLNATTGELSVARHTTFSYLFNFMGGL